MAPKRVLNNASLIENDKSVGSLSKLPSSPAGNVTKNSQRTTRVGTVAVQAGL